MEEQLSADTQAILLLCGHFGKKTDIKPLTVSEYARLAQWLQMQEMRPGDLLDTSSAVKIKHIADKSITAGRLLALLMRGGALALAIETWSNKGLWVISRSDSAYPMRLKKQLGQAAPPIFYGVGQQNLLQKGGLAVVGSRDVEKEVIEFTKLISKKAAQQRMPIISGGARGVDTEAMLTALIHGGTAVGVLADSLVRAAVASKYRDALREERLVLISPFDPSTSFNVGNAMARNKYVYALSDWAMVVNSAYQEGGTWAGAQENLKAKWVPLFVRQDKSMPVGNQELLNQGAIPLDKNKVQDLIDLREQLSQLADQKPLQVSETECAEYSHEVATASTKEETESDEESSESAVDLFNVVWPTIEQQLVTEKTEQALADCLNIEIKQLRLWLKRGLEMGRIKKLKKPVRYVKAEPDYETTVKTQQSLFG
jgi:predicted Rossmann fold nucleotide-binding protein DprA/Smf involved in DNA uptake